MHNPFSELPIIEANWFDSLEEAKNFIFEETEGMEAINPDIQFVESSGFTKLVEILAFVDLTTFTKYEFIINVNNGVYEVDTQKKQVVLFYEYCKWGHLEKCKEILQQNHSPKFLASGFVAAISNDQLSVVKYLVENNFVPKNVLLNSPLYDTIFNGSINCFKYLSQHFEPQENLLPYMLEQNSINILKVINTNTNFKNKVLNVSQKDWDRIQRGLQNHKYDYETKVFFKSHFFKSITINKQ
ncbi:ankyrin repeat domain-containing protein [Kaistella carnis]|uniref:ankyrin repeat domain-containing protein n=1 Tax=Kaistella carnis TaxID=1241979 RepID=UPI00289D2D10|nr:hypothetical protein [Kaistella carnis]